MTPQPWDRQRSEQDGLEPMLWFGRFNTYRLGGPERSLLSAQNEHRVKNGNKKYNSISGSWTAACKKWHWQERAEAYDLAEMERIEAQFKADCDAWRVERFKDAVTLREKARGFLVFPIKQTVGHDKDGLTFIVKPVSSKQMRDAAAILKVADELARTTTRETLPVTKVAPVTPDGKEEYGKDADRQRLALLNQLLTSEQASDGGPDTE